MPSDRALNLAKRLFQLHVSHAGVVELLTTHSLDIVERQLDYLPYRKAKRPEAFIIEAIRRNYSPPKEYFYAKTPPPDPQTEPLLDETTEPRDRQTDADPERHPTESPPHPHPGNFGLEPGGQSRDLALPPTDEALRP